MIKNDLIIKNKLIAQEKDLNKLLQLFQYKISNFHLHKFIFKNINKKQQIYQCNLLQDTFMILFNNMNQKKKKKKILAGKIFFWREKFFSSKKIIIKMRLLNKCLIYNK